MIKLMTKFELVINEKSYQLLCDHDSPILHCKEFAFQFLKYLGQLEDAANESKKSEEAKEKIEV